MIKLIAVDGSVYVQ